MNTKLTIFAVLIVSLISTLSFGMSIIETFRGEAAFDQFGISVTGGDFNNDGWTDLVVGANVNDAGGNAAGRAYLYLGGEMDTIADLVLTGQIESGHFGWCVRGIGDFDGDGFEDLAIGAHFCSDVNTRAGKVYVFLGSDSLDSEADLIFSENLYDARLGYSIAGGDFNGDGYSDIAVGAPNAYNIGLVKVFLGGSNPDSICDFEVHGEGTYDLFGSALALEGDLNGDGYRDLVVGAQGYNGSSGFNTGRVYVYFGSSSPDTVADLIIDGEHANDFFGSSVSTTGDMDIDGYVDLCVGSYGSDYGDSSEVGKVYIFRGGPLMDRIADFILWSGSTHNEDFGISVSEASVGSLNPPMILVGADCNDQAGVDSGRAYVFFGPEPQAGSPDDEASGSEPGSLFGHSVLLASNVLMGDQSALALIGAYSESDNGTARLFGIDRSGVSKAALMATEIKVIQNPVGRLSKITLEASPRMWGRRFSILDVTGRSLYSGRLPFSQEAEIDLEPLGLAAGVYFLYFCPEARSAKVVIIR